MTRKRCKPRAVFDYVKPSELEWCDHKTGTRLAPGAVQNWPTPATEEWIRSVKLLEEMIGIFPRRRPASKNTTGGTVVRIPARVQEQQPCVNNWNAISYELLDGEPFVFQPLLKADQAQAKMPLCKHVLPPVRPSDVLHLKTNCIVQVTTNNPGKGNVMGSNLANGLLGVFTGAGVRCKDGVLDYSFDGSFDDPNVYLRLQFEDRLNPQDQNKKQTKLWRTDKTYNIVGKERDLLWDAYVASAGVKRRATTTADRSRPCFRQRASFS